MTRNVLPVILLLAVTGLSACHTDPFSMKPDVRGVRLPDKPAPQEEAQTGDESPAPADQTPD